MAAGGGKNLVLRLLIDPLRRVNYRRPVPNILGRSQAVLHLAFVHPQLWHSLRNRSAARRFLQCRHCRRSLHPHWRRHPRRSHRRCYRLRIHVGGDSTGEDLQLQPRRYRHQTQDLPVRRCRYSIRTLPRYLHQHLLPRRCVVVVLLT